MSFIDAEIIARDADPEEYHEHDDAERGDVSYPISASTLKLIGECPLRWLEGYEPPESKAKSFGNLVDTLLLTPGRFSERYAVKPETYPAGKDHAKVKSREIKIGDPLPWHAGATFCKEWEADRKSNGIEIVSYDEHSEAQAAVVQVVRDPILKSFLDACDRQVWVMGTWLDEATGIKFPVQCLCDLVPRIDTEFCKAMGDLKTTKSAGHNPFKRWMIKAKYHVQAAFHMDLYRAATKEDRTDWCWLLVENYSPFRTGRRLASEALIGQGRREYELRLAQYAQYLKSGKFPGYDDTKESASTQGWTVIHHEDWMEYDLMSEAMAFDQAQAEEEEEAPQSDDIIP